MKLDGIKNETEMRFFQSGRDNQTGQDNFCPAFSSMHYLFHSHFIRSSRPEVSWKKLFLETQNSQENTCVFEKETGVKKETLAQLLSCGFCDISKNIFSYRARPLVLMFCFKLIK